MKKICTNCRKFFGCQKNAEAWDEAKELYPVSKEDAAIDHHPMTVNERLRLDHINRCAQNCKEGSFSNA